MKWKVLKSLDQVSIIKKESNENPVLIFKHSTRCNISRATLDRLERNWSDDEMPNVITYFLDLLSYREISNYLAELFKVEHESPQVLIIQNERSTYDRSHFEIDYQKIKEILKSQS
jgi:bacillithiol system protein YtxJ